MNELRYSPLLELVKTRVREFVREKGVVFWVFGFPLLMAVGLGLAFRSRPPELPEVALVGSSERVEGVAEALRKSGRVDVQVLGEKAAQRALARAKVDVIVRVGDGDEPAVRTSEPSLLPENVEYVFDETQDKGPVARLVVDDVLQRVAGRKDAFSPTERTESEPGSRYIDFLIPGLIALNLMGGSMWGVGYNLVVARKRRLLRRYAVTPMRRSHFLLSYFFSRSLFLVLELSLLVGFGAVAFGSYIQGSYFAFAVLGFLGAAAFAGISLLIGARVENTESANGWMNLVQLPMWVLSGVFFSYERFPEWLHVPIRMLPLTGLSDALRAIWNDGAGLLSVWPEMLVLVVWGGAGFVIALRTFRWQ